MTVEESLYKQVKLLKNDFVNGSSTLTLKAMEIVTAALDLKGNLDISFAISIANKLKESKPAMGAIPVICDYIITDFFKYNSLGIKYYSDGIRNKLLYAKRITFDKAYNHLFKDINYKVVNIVTCSFSSNVLDLIAQARKKGKNIKVFIVESYFHNRNLSSILAYELQKKDIISDIIGLEQLPSLLPEMSFVLLGADGFDDDGNMVNGTPSLEMLKLCFGKISSYVVAESFKRVKKLQTDDGFDFIESKYIKEIISDDGDWTVPSRVQTIENTSRITARIK